MKRVQITIETDYASEEAFLNSHLFYFLFRPLLSDKRVVTFLIEEVEA